MNESVADPLSSPWHDAVITTVAGTGEPGWSSDNGPAMHARLRQPFFVAFDPAGNLLVAEYENAVIRKINRRGRITTLAGQGGVRGDSGDNGQATRATFVEPPALAVDRDGTVYVVDRGARKIRRVDGKTGTITTLAGTGEKGSAGDDGPANRAALREPHDVVLDGRGGLLIADVADGRIRRVDLRTGTITTWGGTGRNTHAGDNGSVALASFAGPRALAVNARDKTVYVCEREGNTVRRVDGRTGRVTTIAGTGEKGYRDDNGPATQATLNGPKGVFCDARTGDLFVVDTENHAIRRVDARTGTITTVAGGRRGAGGDNGPARLAGLDRPHGVAIDPQSGALLIADSNNHRIRRVAPAVNRKS